MPRVSRKEWLLALAVSVALVAVLSFPYLVGHNLARPGTYFTGLVMNPEDSQSYFAKMLQGYDGQWLYTIPFTPEVHRPAFVGGFYLALGHLARALNLSLVQIWHLARIIASLFLFLVTFRFIAYFLRRPRWRWTAYLLAVVGSGLGWLLLVLNQPQWLGAFLIDFRMPESHLFFTALTFPHVAAGPGLLLIVFLLYLKALRVQRRGWHFALVASLANLCLAIVYPFLIYLVGATIGLHWLYLAWRERYRSRGLLWRRAGLVAIVFAAPLPLYLYYVYTNQVNDVYRTWAKQAATPSPPWPHYLVAYGLLIVPALLPLLRKSWRAVIDDSLVFLWLWLAAAAILLYGPVGQQRRFVQGLQAPLAILATIGLKSVIFPWLVTTKPFRRLASRPRYSTGGLVTLLLFAFVAFSAISSLYLWVDVSATTAIVQPYPFFRAEEEADAAQWLRANGDPSGVVLATYETGNYVAAQAGFPVVIGHWAETVNWSQRLVDTNAFYDISTGDDWRRDFLDAHDVRYVWHGPLERAFGAYDPGFSSFLQLLYSGPETQIYAVRP